MIQHNIKPKLFRFIKLLSFIFIVCFVSCKNEKTVQKESSNEVVSCQSESKLVKIIAKGDGLFQAKKTRVPIQIDVCNKDAAWTNTDWYGMNYIWMGNKVDSTDYHGRFKLAWDHQYLYILVEVIDDYIHPTLKNGLENFWKGDYVEVFIDEDKSGGNHKFNHQAFAYHVSTEGHSIDQSIAQKPVFFDNHIEVKRSQEGTKHLWEMAIKLFDKEFDENTTNNIPVKIFPQKNIEFSIAYGDNDGTNSRENFMGSKKTDGNNNDDGINSDVFGRILFIE
jgi:hypothetical protein